LGRKPFITKQVAAAEAATDSTPKPADYELGSLESRAAARALLDARRKPKQRIRLIFCCPDMPLNLQQESTCSRHMWPGGILFEMLFLNGSDADLTDEQLEAFIQGFSIRASDEHET
jgi:hypothetical protein